MVFRATIVIGSTVCPKDIEGKNQADAVKHYIKHSWSSRHIAEPAYDEGTYHIIAKADKSRHIQGHLMISQPSECSICRRVHGREIRHACE